MTRANVPTLLGTADRVSIPAGVSIIVVGPEMTPTQRGWVTMAIRVFADSYNTASVDLLTLNRTAPDGTKVKMEKFRGLMSITVYTSGGDEEIPELYHGLAVNPQGDWGYPSFLFRLDDGTKEFKRIPIQIIDGGNTNHAMLPLPPSKAPNKWWFIPMLLASKNVWSFKKKTAVLDGTVEKIPVLFQAETAGKVLIGAATKNGLYKPDGDLLYTPPALPSEYPAGTELEGEDVLTRLQPNTDIKAENVFFPQYRKRELFVGIGMPPRSRITIGFYQCTKDTSEIPSYGQGVLAARTTFITTLPSVAVSLPGLPPTAKPDACKTVGLNESNVQGNSSCLVSPPQLPTINNIYFNVFFDSTDAEIFSGSGGATKEAYTNGPPVEVGKVMPNYVNPSEPIKLMNGLNYIPGKTVVAQIASRKADAAPVFGIGQNGAVKPGSGLFSSVETMKIYSHSSEADDAYVSLDFGALGEFKILVATFAAGVSGKDVKKVNTYTNNYYTPDFRFDMGCPRACVPAGIPCDTGPNNTSGQQWHATALSTKLDFDVLPPPGVVETNDIEEPGGAGTYIFKSRYVIDGDMKIGLLVCIVVTVRCSNVRWRQKENARRGVMELWTVPDYEVEVGTAVYKDGDFSGDGDYEQLFYQREYKPLNDWEPFIVENIFLWPSVELMELYPMAYSLPPNLTPSAEAYKQLDNITNGQSSNPYLAGWDLYKGGDKGPDVPPEQLSTVGIEKSTTSNGQVTPHNKLPRGVLYGRSFTLREFEDTALWMLKSLKIDSPDITLAWDDPNRTSWFYFPDIPAELDKKRRLELLDGGRYKWSDEMPVSTAQNKIRPEFEDRDITVYYI